MLVRTLTQVRQNALPAPWRPRQTADGRLDIEAVLDAFVTWWHRHGDQLGLTQGWMVVFDQRAGRTWEQRLWRDEVTQDGKSLHVYGA